MTATAIESFGSFCFVHAADLHVDSQLRGLSRYEGAPVEQLRGATRRALENLVDLCLSERARFLLIAGDVFDGSWKDYNTGLFFNQQMQRLGGAGVRVLLISGNHDAESEVSRRLSLPDNVINLSTRKAETVRLDEVGVAVHGRGYGRAAETDNLAAAYPPPLPGYFNIGLLHTALDGREGHSSYAPCSAGELGAHGYDYWALGHVHRREEVARDPWIVFPGNLQGRHARETGSKGASQVVVRDGGIEVRHRPLDVLRWVRCEVALDEAGSALDAVARVQRALDREVGVAEGRALAVRLRLTGASPAHAQLMTDRERWVNELRSAAGELDGAVWLEKIALETRPALDLAALARADDPLGGLLRSLRRLREDGGERAELAAELARQVVLPPDYRRLPDALDPGDADGLVALLDDVERRLLPRLLRDWDGADRGDAPE